MPWPVHRKEAGCSKQQAELLTRSFCSFMNRFSCMCRQREALQKHATATEQVMTFSSRQQNAWHSSFCQQCVRVSDRCLPVLRQGCCILTCVIWAADRHNQELEQDALATEQEKAKLQQAADSLAEQLDAILHDKFDPSGSTGFDADTPIDKTMKFLQGIVMVSFSL